MTYEDRRGAGRRLADQLERFADDDPLVLGLPRGGVPVAHEVARRLDAPLDVVLVRKVGAPGNPEYGIGAVGEEGVTLIDDAAVDRLGLSRDDLDGAVDRERAELERRLERYRGGRAGTPVRGRTCILVDDGLATGISATAAVRVLRSRGADRIIVAVPVGSPDSVERLRGEADEVVCLLAPPSFTAVGTWYHDFSQTSDDEVVELLAATAETLRSSTHHQVPAAGVTLPADLVIPPTPLGLVIFAHGSGSSRESPRNRHVARVLNDAGLATLLFDLLTPVESQVRDHVFDVDLLAARLDAALAWGRGRPELAALPVGLFGASTGAAAALTSAARSPERIGAVVSRGGRPGLARELGAVSAPTLLLVGEDDEPVRGENEAAARELGGHVEITVVPGAGHLFEEPGALDAVAAAARDWFVRHLPD